MVSFELDGVEIDRCAACGGTWLDLGELEQLALMAGAPPGPLSEALATGRGEKHGDRRCVRCASKLRVLAVNGVEVDRCPHGCGLWFDAGEVPKLVSSFHDGEGGAVARHFGDLFKAEIKGR
jgi:Zn-finger nucleic acid-binding protein